jgi:hypothetical protein
MPGYPERIWYFPDGAANVLSMQNMSKHLRIPMDSNDENTLIIHSGQALKGKIQFTVAQNGLYYHDVKTNKGNYKSSTF